MKNDYDNKTQNRIIVMMLIVVSIMLVAVTALALRGKIMQPSDNIQDVNWKIEFTNIKEIGKKGLATSLSLPEFVASYLSFDVSFKAPGDELLYEVEVSNLGTIDAVLEGYTYNTTDEDDIVYEIIGINQNDALDSGNKITFTIKVSYSKDATVVRDFNKSISMYFNFVQAY